MTRAKGFNKQKKQQALSRVAQGYSYEAVGQEFGVAPDTIYRLVKSRSQNGKTVTAKGKFFGVRLSESQENSLNVFKEKGGFKTNAEAMRALLLYTDGYLSCSAGARTEFENLKSQVQGIANNINQVAYAANRKNIDLIRSQWEDVEELQQGLKQFVRKLDDALDEMRGNSTKLWRKSEYGRG